MRKRPNPKFQNQARHPITEDGIYELKWTCKCCGSVDRITTEVYVKDGLAGYPCECDSVAEPHLKVIEDYVYYRRVEND